MVISIHVDMQITISLYEAHCHGLTFPTIRVKEKTFSESTHSLAIKRQKDAVNNCTTSYCFKTVLSLIVVRKKSRVRVCVIHFLS